MNQVVPATAKSVALAEHSARLQEQTQYLTFMLNGEPFAIGILCIKEIIEYGHVTPVPMMPDFVRGVLNLRGAVVPVLDLAARFGLSLTEAGRDLLVAAEPSVLRAQRRMLEPLADDKRAQFMEMLSLLIHENDEFARATSAVAQRSAESKRSAAVKEVKGLTGKLQGSEND